MNQRIWNGNPPAPADANHRHQVTVDLIAGGDMRGLWVYVNRHGLAKPHIEIARKQVGMDSGELADLVTSFLRSASHQLRATNGAKLLNEWYAPALFTMEDAA